MCDIKIKLTICALHSIGTDNEFAIKEPPLIMQYLTRTTDTSLYDFSPIKDVNTDNKMI